MAIVATDWLRQMPKARKVSRSNFSNEYNLFFTYTFCVYILGVCGAYLGQANVLLLEDLLFPAKIHRVLHSRVVV